MATALNKNRIRDSWLIALFCALLFALTGSMAESGSYKHEAFDFIGYILITACALGRVYTTAFLGGHKNRDLIAYGPFSVVRNPLYIFSWIGVLGISLASMRPLIMIAAPLLIGAVYYFLIRREEVFLQEKFGQKYYQYASQTPRLIPNFTLYKSPAYVSMNTDRLLAGVLDAVWWFVPLPVFELLETFHL